MYENPGGHGPPLPPAVDAHVQYMLFLYPIRYACLHREFVVIVSSINKMFRRNIHNQVKVFPGQGRINKEGVGGWAEFRDPTNGASLT